MATLSADRLTLVELAKRHKDGKVQAIAEVLNKVNSILDDAIWLPANGQTSHTTTQRLSLPAGSWRKLNEGVSREASHTKQIVENIGILEAYSQVDAALVELADDPASFRFSEDMAFIEGMSQTLATALIYGTTTGAPEKINGFATRYNLTSLDNVDGASGTGSDTSSLYLVQWGPDKVHMVYPRTHSSFGLSHEDDGVLTTYDSNNNPYKVFQSHFKVYAGLVVRDDRCVQRVANIETSGSSNILDEDQIIRALRRMPNGGQGAVMYCNKTIMTQLDIIAKDKTNVTYMAENPFGMPVMVFRGVPVRQLDAILDTETAIS